MTLKYFTLDEFACKCGQCGGENRIDPLFVLALDRARESATTPFAIISGYRCADHPESLKNPTSSHRAGVAADVATPDSHTRFLILRALIEHGFTRIGINRNSLHVDSDEQKPGRLAWTYY